MTDEKKYNLISKMLDAPETLTDDELDLIVSDDELIGMLDASAKLKAAYTVPANINAEEEWKRFRPRIKRLNRMPARWWMRAAAIFLGVIFLSALLVRLTGFVLTPGRQPFVADAEQAPQQERPAAGLVAEPVIPDKAPVAAPTHVVSSTKMAKSHKRSVKKEIDIDEYVRIQQARIDNNIATLMEEIKEKENLALQRWHEDENETVITINI